MKNKAKKIWGILLASMMIVMSCMTVFAEGPAPISNIPKSSDSATITVKNVEDGATVSWYKIVQADYGTNGEGLTGYSPVEGVVIANVEAPTASEITTIAAAINGGTLTSLASGTLTRNESGNYTAEVEAGSYLVLVRGTGTTIYNPLVVSAGYGTEDSVLKDGEVDVNGRYTISGETAYAKSSEPDIKKTITDEDAENEHGKSMAVGDQVGFKIETTLPDYSDEYADDKVTFEITDTLSKGLSYVSDTEGKTFTILVDGTELTGDELTNSDITSLIEGQTATINFPAAYVKENGGKAVVITYKAELNDQAGINFDVNTNTATLTYTHDPFGVTKTDSSKTYQYTFGIDANLNGTSGTGTGKTHEIIKVGENGKVEVIEKKDEIIDQINVTAPLAGDEFTLTKDGKSITSTTDENGYLSFTGLDIGTYELVESKAPNGYSLDTTKHTVVISAEFNEDGTLRQYSIAIDGKATSTYEATYKSGSDEIEIIKSVEEVTTIKNTKVNNLPSTGGIGTYIFTILGVVLMGSAAALFLRKSKRA